MKIRPLLLVASLGLMAASVFSAWVEARPFFLRGAALDGRIEALTSPGVLGPEVELASPLARRTWIDLCLKAAADVGDLKDLYAVRSVLLTCRRLAETAASAAPASSNMWLVTAMLALRTQGLAASEEPLSRSFATGPSEGWVAVRRWSFFFPYRDRLAPELAKALDADAALLMRTNTGLDLFAGQYVSSSEVRPYLTDILDRLDDETKRRFIGRVTSRASPKPAQSTPSSQGGR